MVITCKMIMRHVYQYLCADDDNKQEVRHEEQQK